MRKMMILAALAILTSSQAFAAKALVCWDTTYHAGGQIALSATLLSDTELTDLVYYGENVPGSIKGELHTQNDVCSGRNDFSWEAGISQMTISLPRAVTQFRRRFYAAIYSQGSECSTQSLLSCVAR